MFNECIDHAGGFTTGTATEAHAMMLLQRGQRRGCHIEATRAGGALVSWTRLQFGPVDGQVDTVARSIKLTPVTPLTSILRGGTVRHDLATIDAHSRSRWESARSRRVVVVGLDGIEAVTGEALHRDGLVTEAPGGRVRLTLAARLGLLAYEHRRRTPWRGRAAYCTCGMSAPGSDPRAEARDVWRAHLRAVTAEFVTGLARPSARTA
ncbi:MULTISPECIES: hypothetical protein [unclassified Streptomyces]|uniref:hypothetical protein n=1 Tax=unclassified Streptomyces TaxID=2593676 RepID=UPI00037E8B32|nr:MULTISPECIES: hypothetical protein [unclassified Streptomyces]MYX36521.1 hypothetical protein [Streptomyces sp. SID8377]